MARSRCSEPELLGPVLGHVLGAIRPRGASAAWVPGSPRTRSRRSSPPGCGSRSSRSSPAGTGHRSTTAATCRSRRAAVRRSDSLFGLARREATAANGDHGPVSASVFRCPSSCLLIASRWPRILRVDGSAAPADGRNGAGPSVGSSLPASGCDWHADDAGVGPGGEAVRDVLAGSARDHPALAGRGHPTRIEPIHRNPARSSCTCSPDPFDAGVEAARLARTAHVD